MKYINSKEYSSLRPEDVAIIDFWENKDTGETEHKPEYQKKKLV
jgi:hypothetical protein